MTRRSFLAAAAAVPLMGDKKGPTLCMFSKHFPELNYAELGKTCKDLGFAGIDLTVRPKGHVLPERVAEDLPRAVDALRKAGLEVPMITTLIPRRRWKASHGSPLRRIRPSASLFTLLIVFPAIALAQSPFDTGFTAMQTLFTGTVAKVASLIAIVVGGYQFAHGEPGAKKTLAGVAAGTGIAVLATNVLTWLWGV